MERCFSVLFTGCSMQRKIINEDEKIAVIGIGCRFPGANNCQEYWNLLREGRCAIKYLPNARYNLELDKSNDNYKNKYQAGYLDNIDQFDPSFFGLTPHDAIQMDPQQRLLLEVVWEAFEDAGIVVKDIAGSATGVFMATGFSSLYYFQQQVFNSTADIYSLFGTQSFGIANRISYFFDFHGPSFAVDAACASSLVAVDEACMRILNGQCSLAIAGGSNFLLSSNYLSILKEVRLTAPDYICKAFDNEANGYVCGEGVGVVVLKPLSQAIKDKNYIYAIILGNALNHGGKNGRGFAYPNSEAQAALIQTAYKNARVSVNEVHYIEAHGTGTSVGDEVELKGIAQALSSGREDKDYCEVGSVKTNIGHLEYAAGIASLIKVCLILQEKEIPPSLHFKKFNDNFSAINTSIKIPTQLHAWPKNKKLIAGVSGFGLGGTNVHMVLTGIDDYLKDNKRIEQCGVQVGLAKNYLFPITARSANALRNTVLNYIEFIDTKPKLKLQDLCHSASLNRDHHRYRLALVCKDTQNLSCKLKKFIANDYHDVDIFYGETTVDLSPDFMNNSIALDKHSMLCFCDQKIQDFLSSQGIMVHSLLKYCNLELNATRSLARLYIDGYPLNWGNINFEGIYIKLPSYAWQKKTYWL